MDRRGRPGSIPDELPPGGLVELLDGFPVDSESPWNATVQRALCLARFLQQRATALQTPQERKQQTELDRMIHHPGDKATLMQLTDQAFRSQAPHRAADQLIHILDVQGVPRFFSPLERTMLKGFQSFGAFLPGVAVPLVKERMQRETANVILPAARELLTAHLRERRSEGVRMNVNFLGEALLGERAAEQRLQRYLEALQLPELEVLSVKISTIDSQISPLARRATVARLCDRLELLYRAAAKERFERADGTRVSKLVYLDMEEYRDMTLTAEAFMRTLDRPGLERVRAGIVLQAYLPDSLAMQGRLTTWARRRVDAGGEPITLRIVKGANMEMERFDAVVHDWPAAPYQQKLETDANYKRMLHEGLLPENLRAVRIGIASHNLFDVAYGVVLAVERGAFEHVQFEMLEGMANHQRRALFELDKNVLLYAPACEQHEFIHAIGYLVRRLDENTGPDNFLRHTFKLRVDSDEWRRLEAGFLASLARLDDTPRPRRTQDRRSESPSTAPESAWWELANEPDTDFALPHHTEWAEGLLQGWEDRCGDAASEVPLQIDGEELYERPLYDSVDPSRPGAVAARCRQASVDDLRRAVESARDDRGGWRRRSVSERRAILRQVAAELRRRRGELIGAALIDGGKLVTESDPEVSEAVDFVEFYSRCAVDCDSRFPQLEVAPRGVVAVVSPWNFPIAIPCGGVAAALAAGNNVLLKPASDCALPAWLLCQAFWEAGVPRDALQFVPCPGRTAASLVANEHVDTVILTGGTSTALAMLAGRPSMRLLAETGGKNATIVTALADRDQAIKNVLHSAFGHSGQKCSATSLLILEDEVYHDAGFRETLCDAVESLRVGSAWELETRVGPLIRPPSGVLEQGLKELEHGESWAVLPRMIDDNPHLWSPGVKWGVAPGSFTHLTEFFGPLLGVMRARNLAEAIGMVNQTGYGLTSGLESLDDREQQQWLEGIRAGNLYVNRGTTGAIVLRQPFGGMGKSSFGPGMKAGGPNYVPQLLRFTERDSHSTERSLLSDPGTLSETQLSDSQLDGLLHDMLTLAEAQNDTPRDELLRTAAALVSYDRAMREEFSQRHDHFRLPGQDNFRRYVPVDSLRVRVSWEDSWYEILARAAAARAAGCRVTVSTHPEWESDAVRLLDELTDAWGAAIEFVEETDEELAEVIRERRTDRVRYAAPARTPECVLRAVAESGVFVASAPVLAEGRLELLWYLQEQSISDNYHRYGNLGLRGAEQDSRG